MLSRSFQPGFRVDLHHSGEGGLDRSAVPRGVPRQSRHKLDRNQETS